MNKKGITLIALVVTIIVMMVLAGIVLAVLSTDDNFISKALGTKKESVEGSIKEYVLSSYTQVITNPDLDKDPIDELEERIMLENEGKKEEEKFVIKFIDKENKIIIIEHQGVEVEINLTVVEDGKIDASSEETQHKKYSVRFEFRDTEGVEQKLVMYINKNQTLQDYLNSSQESFPTEKEWEPTLNLNSPVIENRVYREKVDKDIIHTVKFNLDGGNIGGQTAIPDVLVEDQQRVTNPGTPVKEHNVFEGWIPPITTFITTDTTFTAQWTPVTYTYTFNLNGGSIGGSTENRLISGLYNTPSSTPENPIKEHYTFSGWSPSVPSTFNGNKEFTAQWTAVTYTFTFNLNEGSIGGSTANRTTSGLYDTNSSTPGTPTRAHHTFGGWSPTVPAKFNGNKTFTAQWVEIHYTFTFNLNGGSIGGSSANRTTTGMSGSPSSTPGTPTRTNFTFEGWSPTVPITFNGNTTFTAVWRVTYTFNLNGGNIGGSTTNKTTTGLVGANTTTPANPVRTNYIFDGWSPTVPSKYDQDTTFTAQWVREYTFTFNLNGGNIGGSTANQIFKGKSGTASSKPTNPTRTDFTFDSWSPAVPSTFNADTTFTAQWRATYTFNLDGGNIGGSTTNPTTSGLVGATTTKPANPTRTGYVFLEWTPAVPSKYDKNTTFKALWSKPMEIIVRKSSASQSIYIPITLSEGKFMLISLDGAAYVKYTAGTPLLTSSKAANTNINIKIAGRIDRFNYDYNTSYSGQMYQLVKWGEISSLRYKFPCANMVGPIPAPETNTFTYVTSCDTIFSGCTSLTGSIPSGLFASAVNTSLYYAGFNGCAGLTGSIPANLFLNNSKVTTYQSIFNGCKGLTGSIPGALFSYSPNVTNFSYAFTNCEKLSGLIPSNLFANNTLATHFTSTLFGCKGLTGSIPAALFTNCPLGYDYYQTFYGCTGLTGTIPATLFTNQTQVNGFTGTFYGCKGLSGAIPENLFSKCTTAKYFNYTFINCTGLTSVSTKIFNNCQNVTGFRQTFDGCTNLGGTAPVIWQGRTNVEEYSYCFRGCTKLSNYSSIPSAWK